MSSNIGSTPMAMDLCTWPHQELHGQQQQQQQQQQQRKTNGSSRFTDEADSGEGRFVLWSGPFSKKTQKVARNTLPLSNAPLM